MCLLHWNYILYGKEHYSSNKRVLKNEFVNESCSVLWVLNVSHLHVNIFVIYVALDNVSLGRSVL